MMSKQAKPHVRGMRESVGKKPTKKDKCIARLKKSLLKMRDKPYTTASGIHSRLQLSLFPYGKRVSRITLGEVINNHEPQPGMRLLMRVGGVFGKSGTADVTLYTDRNGEKCAAVFMKVRGTDKRVARIKDLLNAAQLLAREKKAEFIGIDVPRTGKCDPTDEVLKRVFDDLQWSPHKHWSHKGLPMVRMGLHMDQPGKPRRRRKPPQPIKT